MTTLIFQGHKLSNEIILCSKIAHNSRNSEMTLIIGVGKLKHRSFIAQYFTSASRYFAFFEKLATNENA